MLRIKRAYEAPSKDDGYRILVDKLWPRGMNKEKEHLYSWAKEITPSAELRQSFGHKKEKFTWFKKEYIKELDNNPAARDFISEIKSLLSKKNVTLIYAAKDPKINHAVILKEYIEKKM